jgi:predicted GIY-YIG superfamily endonuclease
MKCVTAIFRAVKTYQVNILTNKRLTVLFTGVTSDLEQRIFEHKTKFHAGSFTATSAIDLFTSKNSQMLKTTKSK